jgi:hypothetical protein
VPLEHDAAPQIAPAPVAAPGPGLVAPAHAGAPMADEQILSLQQTAGNRAVGRAIARGLIQRDDKPPANLSGVAVSPQKASIPLSGTTITAAASPKSAGTIKYKLQPDKVAPAAGTSIDESTGAVTVDAKQPGGSLKVRAENEVSYAESTFKLVEKPAAIASTTAAAQGTYEAGFTHTFTSAGASVAGLDGENINEKFDSKSATTPFGPFTLKANAAGSKGWDLDASGTMAGTDNVSIGSGIDASPFVKNASNPAPAKPLPQGFTMTQKLHAKTFPPGTLDDAPFTTTDHVRTLEEQGGKLKMTLTSGGKPVSIDYAGPPVFRNMKADKTKVEASPEKPKSGTWKQNEVQVSIDTDPAGAKVAYSIAGEALGCKVDKNGLVKIGSKAGSITVRGGDAKHYDEVTIQITAPAAPPPAAGGAAPKTADNEAGGEDDGAQEATA